MSSVNNTCSTCSPIGLTIPFTNSDNGYFQQTFDTNNQVKQNIINFLNTKRGERRMQPTFGTRLYELVFQQNDTNTQEIAKSIISQEFSTWIPEATVTNISINSDTNNTNIDNYKMVISIQYVVKKTKQQDLVSIQVQNLQ